MASYSFNNFSSGNCYSAIFDPFSRDLGSCNGSSREGCLPLSQSLVLDSEKRELVKAPVKSGKKTVSEEKITSISRGSTLTSSCNIAMVSFKATICCDYRAQLLTDLHQALHALPFPIKIVKSEISTLGSRLKNDFVFTASYRSTSIVAHVVDNDGDADAWRFLSCSIRESLEKASTALEYSQFLTFPNKRRRISYVDSSCSSSCSKKD